MKPLNLSESSAKPDKKPCKARYFRSLVPGPDLGCFELTWFYGSPPEISDHPPENIEKRLYETSTYHQTFQNPLFKEYTVNHSILQGLFLN